MTPCPRTGQQRADGKGSSAWSTRAPLLRSRTRIHKPGNHHNFSAQKCTALPPWQEHSTCTAFPGDDGSRNHVELVCFITSLKLAPPIADAQQFGRFAKSVSTSWALSGVVMTRLRYAQTSARQATGAACFAIAPLGPLLNLLGHSEEKVSQFQKTLIVQECVRKLTKCVARLQHWSASIRVADKSCLNLARPRAEAQTP